MSADLTGQRLGHYLVQEVIGRGGMSVVYRGIDQRLQRSVALKVMSEELSADPEFRARFLDEARAASAIDHVNVVPLYDFGETGGALFIAMRLVDGTDLARELAAGPIPVRRALALLGQVGAALDMLHDRGLVHLDVKPANVLITRNESVGTEHIYLADFGLTRRGAGGHRTAAGDFLGSPSYASPEHLRGAGIGPASDEYSMTCMLFATLAGRPPYVGDVRTVVTGHLSGVVPSLSALADVPPALDRVIARGLAADPALRYGSISDLLTAVRRAIADGDDTPAGAGTPPPGTGTPPAGTVTPPAGAVTPPAAGVVAGHGARQADAVNGRAAAAAGWPPPQPAPAQSGYPVSIAPGGSAFIQPARPVSVQPARQVSIPPGGQVSIPPVGSVSVQRGGPGSSAPVQAARSPFVAPAHTAAIGQHRPAAHRIEPARSRWPWLLAVVLFAVLAVVVVVVATHPTGSGSLAPVGPPPAVAAAALPG